MHILRSFEKNDKATAEDNSKAHRRSWVYTVSYLLFIHKKQHTGDASDTTRMSRFKSDNGITPE